MLDFIRVVLLLLLLPPPPHFLSGFEPAAGHAPNASVQLQPASKPQERWQSAPSNRLRPFVAAKIMFYRVSNLPTGRLQIPPCSCSLPASPKKWQSAQVTGFGLLWPPKSFFTGFRTCRRAGSKCVRPCSCSLPPSPKKGGKARLRPCMAAKVIFYRVSNLPPGRLQMLPCSCSLPPNPKKGGKARKVIFYRDSYLPLGRLQMLPCSCSLPPSPKKGGKASK